MDPAVTAFANVLRGTQSADQGARQQSEAQLKTFQGQSGFAVNILQLVSMNNVDLPTRQAGSIAFKNFIKKSWDGTLIPDGDKATVKQHILTLMCSTPPQIMRQLSEGLRIMAEVDFPKKWQELLPELIQKLKANMNDMNVVNGVLETANSIFKRFRYVQKSDALFLDLKYVLEGFAEPMLQLFTHLVAQASQAVQANAAAGAVEPFLSALRTLARIFFSLNWQDLPEYFEDHLAEWMKFHSDFLGFTCPAIDRNAIDEEASAVERLQSALIENVALYAEKYEEEFQPHMQTFTNGIWGLLTTLRPIPRFDVVINSAMKFLTSVVKKPWHKDLFADQGTQVAICEKIVVQNIMLRDTDEEDFEDNPIEYLRRDIEGSDSDTRRRGACDLVQGLCVHYQQSVTSICGNYVNTLLEQYRANPGQEWKKKDAAITLVLALSAKGATRAHGATSTNELINVVDFIEKQIVPELRSGPNDGPAILKADAIKFCTMFRQQLPGGGLTVILPLMASHLGASSYVVHTYAAAWLERVLAMKDPAQPASPRISHQVLQPYIQPMLTSLFGIINKPGYPENEYLMKAIMRVIVAGGQGDLTPVAQNCISALSDVLRRVCANPTNPQFNHFLFEALSALVKFVGGKNRTPQIVATFEELLFPPFLEILQKEIDEFIPYIFQILAQLLELRQGTGLSDAYRSLFKPVLTPALWMTRGNVPSLVRLLVAYLKVGPEICVANMSPLLGCWQSAFATPSTSGHSFDLLSVIVTCIPLESIQAQLAHVVRLLLTSLMDKKKRTRRFTQGFLSFLSNIVGKHGHGQIAAIMGAMQPNLFWQLAEQVWVPNMADITSKEGKKASLLAAARILAAPELVGNVPLWVKFLAATATTTTATVGKAASDTDGLSSYSAAHVKLHFGADAYDAFADVSNAEETLRGVVAGAWPQMAGNAQVSAAYSQLSEAMQGAMKAFLAKMGVNI